jgi:hypothetical protein
MKNNAVFRVVEGFNILFAQKIILNCLNQLYRGLKQQLNLCL